MNLETTSGRGREIQSTFTRSRKPSLPLVLQLSKANSNSPPEPNLVSLQHRRGALHSPRQWQSQAGYSTLMPIQAPCSSTGESHENLLRSSASIAQKWTVPPCRSCIQLALSILPVISWPRRYKCTIRTCCLPLMPNPLV